MTLHPLISALLIATLSSPILLGCDKLSNATPEELIERAKDFQAKGDLKSSIIEIKSAIQKDPNNPQARWMLGEIYLKSGMGADAEKELLKAEELGVSNDSIKVAIGEALLLQQQFKRTLEEIQVTPETTTQNRARILRLRGDAMLGLGQLDEACTQYEESIALDTSHVPAYWGLAKCAMARRDPPEAERQIDFALKVDATNPDTWVLKGEFAQHAKNINEAEAAFSNALKVSPEHKNALFDRAFLYLQQDKYELAQRDLAKIKSFAPDHPLTHFLQAAIQYGNGSHQASLSSLQQLFKSQPDFMPAVRLAGIVQYNLKSYEQSINYLRRYLDVFPGDAQARKVLAAALVMLARGDEALKVLQPALTAGKVDDYQLLALAGEAYLKDKNPQAAAEQFEKAAAINPGNVGLHTQLGIVLTSLGLATQGAKEFEKAAKLDPNQRSVAYALVLTYLQQKQYDKALTVLSELEKKTPNDPAISNLKGGTYLGKNDLVNARKSFERALAADPASVAAATNLAQLDLRDKNFARARKRFDGVFLNDKDNLRAQLVMAAIAASEGKEQDYLEWLGKAAKAHPTNAQPRVSLARYYLSKNQGQKALNYAREAVSAQPDNPSALETMGLVQMATGDKASALVSFRRLADIAPDSPQYHFRLASALDASGNASESKKALKRTLELNPDFAPAQSALVALELRDGRYDEAMKIARQTQQRHPKSALPLVWEGNVLMEQRRYPQAIKAYTSAWALERNGVTAIKLFEAHNRAGTGGKGEAAILQWLKERPEDTATRLYLAQAYMTADQDKSAIEQYQILLRREPNNALALNNIAWLYHKSKDPRALDFAERAFKLYPNDAVILDTLGSISMDHGKKARGLELLKKAASLTANPEIRYHYAAALAQSGDKDNARKLIEELLASGKSFPKKEEARALLKQL